LLQAVFIFGFQVFSGDQDALKKRIASLERELSLNNARRIETESQLEQTIKVCYFF
jgi:hypothetical protein